MSLWGRKDVDERFLFSWILKFQSVCFVEERCLYYSWILKLRIVCFVEELLYIHRILKLRSVCFDVVSGLH
jgi:hypothetical protein